MDFEFDGDKETVLARAWGLSVEEMAEIDVQDAGEESSPDGLVYSFIFHVDVDGPWRVLRKIPGLEDEGIVRVHPSVFDLPEPDAD